MKPKPYSMVPGLAENVFVYVFNYAGSDTDFDADKAAYKAELEKHFPIAISNMPSYGLGITGSGGLTATVGASNTTVALDGLGVCDASSMKYGDSVGKPMPVCLYKGTAVPYSDYEYTGWVDGSGTETEPQIELIDKNTYNSNDSDDYVVYWSDHLSGNLVSIEAPNISLPYESSSYGAVGHGDPVIKTTKAGEADASGSITVIEHMTAFIMKTSGVAKTVPENVVGEELLWRIFGGDWTANMGYTAAMGNTLKRPTKPFGICIVQLSGENLESGTTGKLWGKLQFIYHCKLTSIGPSQNISNDTTDPILRTVEFECQYPDSNGETSILIT